MPKHFQINMSYMKPGRINHVKYHINTGYWGENQITAIMRKSSQAMTAENTMITAEKSEWV